MTKEAEDVKVSNAEKMTNIESTKQLLSSIPRGNPKSGRKWKSARENRHSEFKRDKHLKTKWDQKMQQKNERKAVQKYEKELKDAKAQEIKLKKERQAKNIKRREEQQRKAEIVQPIKNTAKIKRMKKKQLRMIEKR